MGPSKSYLIIELVFIFVFYSFKVPLFFVRQSNTHMFFSFNASVGVSEMTTLGTNVTTLDANLDHLGLSYRKNDQIT